MLSAAVLTQAHGGPSVAPPPSLAPERTLHEWLVRMHEAARRRTYTGTFVVSAGNSISSARIWHVCDGDLQMERVEALTGPPRSTFRRNEQLLTLYPDSRLAVAERRESFGQFPNLLQPGGTALGQLYGIRFAGSERVAGLEADVVQLRPNDALRFAYQIWTEKKTGMVLKLQTIDARGRVLEQAAFSELQLDAPVSMTKLAQMMANTEGYQVERTDLVKTSAADQGWGMKSAVPGFQAVSCYLRPTAVSADARPESTLQWIFSDGLATVSLFIEAFEPRRHGQPMAQALGATHTLTRRIGDWWLTAVGEVPPHTLAAFAQALQRK
ncbi:MAG: MucB/RseB C-terminal domain-containing protein [Burkholderiales bacterium]|nr:MucB/RseB C-terminal domain-containing protein [Burkholderiales bacterium]